MYLLSPKPKTYLILGGRLSEVAAERVSNELERIWWRHGRVITGDDYGVNAEVIRQAALRDIPYRVVTVNSRPTNGSRHSLRLLIDDGLSRHERLRLRDQFMVQLADYVITIGTEYHWAKGYAQETGKRFVYSF